MTDIQTTQIQKAGEILFTCAGIAHASTKMCEGLINLAADQFQIYDVEALDEQQISDIVDMLQDEGDDKRDMY